MYKKTKMTEIETQIVVLFARCNMNISETARRGFIHRNTICYHFDKVYESTGLDPRKFFDLVKILNIISEV